MSRWADVNGIYQIYPRSFKDANADGIGDIPGMTAMLDYIKGTSSSLGIDAVWLSPFYRSPMADFGYDVSDYLDVDPLFGTLDDFSTFVEEAHRRNIKVMIDFVLNHTSNQHSWFLESRSSRDNEKRNWYVWRDPKPDGSPPNNWISVPGDSAWQFDGTTGQYYLHSFLAEQPDLNWDNPKVRQEMANVLRFWLAHGVDGIRADAVRWISKDSQLRDDPINEAYEEGDSRFETLTHRYSRFGDKLFPYLKEMAAVVQSYPERIILFEDHLDASLDRAVQYHGLYSVNPEVAAPFNFEGIHTPYKARDFKDFIGTFQSLDDGGLRPFYCFGNHDEPRLVSRVGKAQAKLIGLLQLTLPGIPVVYYGDEIGMHDVLISQDKMKDAFAKTSGLKPGRDPERTPMQWSEKENAGFSNVTPWLPVADDADAINVARENEDDESFLSMYRSLLELRRVPAFRTGRYSQWIGSNDNVFGYFRRGDKETFLVLLNMSDKAATCREDVEGEIIFSTDSSVTTSGDGLRLNAHQGVILRRDSLV